MCPRAGCKTVNQTNKIPGFIYPLNKYLLIINTVPVTVLEMKHVMNLTTESTMCIPPKSSHVFSNFFPGYSYCWFAPGHCDIAGYNIKYFKMLQIG